MSHYSEEWLAERLAKNGKVKAAKSTVPTVGLGSVETPSRKKPKRNRYEEHAGEFAQKIVVRIEQLPGSIRLWLPYPPLNNSNWRNVNGKTIKSAESRSYYKLVQEALAGLKPLTGDLEVTMQVYRPQRRGDIDSTQKVTFDSLAGRAFLDDEQISDLHVQRYDGEYAKENPGIQIQIKLVA